MKEEDKYFRDWYKERIERYSENPPEQVWENIQDELDVEEVWGRISDELKNENRVVFLRNIGYAISAAAAVLLLIFLFIPGKILNKDYPQYNLSSNTKNLPNQSEVSLNYPVGSIIGNVDETVLADNLAAGFSSSSHLLSENIVASTLESSDSEQNIEKIPSINGRNLRLQTEYDVSETLVPSENFLTSVSQSVKKENSKRIDYYVGASGQFGNSWLLSQKTLYSIRKTPYSSAQPDQNKTFSLLGGIHYNERIDIQFEAQINNNNGQVYKEYLNGDFVTNRISLDYSTFILSGRYMFLKPGKKIPVSHHIVLGTYGSFLNKAYQDVNGEKESIKEEYKNYDLGLILGYEIDSRITNNLIFSTGVRIDPGFINVYNGSDNLPAGINRTYTSSFGIELSVKYQLKR